MPQSDLGRQLGDGIVEHDDVVGDRVGAGVARPQQPRECITGAVGEAQQGVESETPLVMRSGQLLVLRMDFDERRVDVSSVSSAELKHLQHEPKCSAGLIRLSGHLGS